MDNEFRKLVEKEVDKRLDNRGIATKAFVTGQIAVHRQDKHLEENSDGMKVLQLQKYLDDAFSRIASLERRIGRKTDNAITSEIMNKIQTLEKQVRKLFAQADEMKKEKGPPIFPEKIWIDPSPLKKSFFSTNATQQQLDTIVNNVLAFIPKDVDLSNFDVEYILGKVRRAL